MTKYHVNGKGISAICRAKEGRCPFGSHFDSKAEAELYAKEKYLSEETYRIHQVSKMKYDSESASKRGKFVDKEVFLAMAHSDTKVVHYNMETGQWSPARKKIQDEIIEKFMRKYEKVPNDKKVIFSAGLPGAGKTTVLTSNENLDLDEWATVSADDMKEELARGGHVPEIEGLTPMEASSLVHDESSELADRLLSKLSSQGKNVIYDFTCKMPASAIRRMEILENNGYNREDMRLVFVDIEPATANKRALARYRKGLNEGLEGKNDGIGGRYLPPKIINACISGGKHSSINAESVVELHENHGLDNLKVYNNMGEKPAEVNLADFLD